jgi:hypothetical protein
MLQPFLLFLLCQSFNTCLSDWLKKAVRDIFSAKKRKIVERQTGGQAE